jgi:hypothetical protein
MSAVDKVNKGLEGIVAAETTLSMVDGAAGELVIAVASPLLRTAQGESHHSSTVGLCGTDGADLGFLR